MMGMICHAIPMAAAQTAVYTVRGGPGVKTLWLSDLGRSVAFSVPKEKVIVQFPDQDAMTSSVKMRRLNASVFKIMSLCLMYHSEPLNTKLRIRVYSHCLWSTKVV